MAESLTSIQVTTALEGYLADRKDLGEGEYQDRLIEQAGDQESLTAILKGSTNFVKANPNAFRRGHVASPELSALWAGIVIGRALTRESFVTE